MPSMLAFAALLSMTLSSTVGGEADNYLTLVRYERTETSCHWLWRVESNRKFLLTHSDSGNQSLMSLGSGTGYIDLSLILKDGQYFLKQQLCGTPPQTAGSGTAGKPTDVRNLNRMIEYAVGSIRFGEDPVELYTFRFRENDAETSASTQTLVTDTAYVETSDIIQGN